MLQIPTHIWNDLANCCQLKTKLFQTILKQDDDEIMTDHSRLFRMLTEQMLMPVMVAGVVMKVLPFHLEYEAMEAYLMRHPALRGYLLTLPDPQEALQIALMENNNFFSPEERRQIYRILLMFQALTRVENLPLTQLLTEFPERFFQQYPEEARLFQERLMNQEPT